MILNSTTCDSVVIGTWKVDSVHHITALFGAFVTLYLIKSYFTPVKSKTLDGELDLTTRVRFGQ